MAASSHRPVEVNQMSLTVPAITHCYRDGHVGERWGVSTLHRAEGISAAYEMKHRDTAEHLAKWLQHIHLHHRRLQTMMYSFLSCLKVNELTRLGLLTQTRCDWSVFILQQDLVRICGGVRERVSVWFVYLCMMEDLLMQKA